MYVSWKSETKSKGYFIFLSLKNIFSIGTWHIPDEINEFPLAVLQFTRLFLFNYATTQ